METLDPRLITFSAHAEVDMDKLKAAGREAMTRSAPATPAQQLEFLQRNFPEAPHVARLSAIQSEYPELALLLV